jgi:predicted deacylase
LIDLHAGEFAQDLTPYVCVPWPGDAALRAGCLTLGQAFDVPFLDRRVLEETPLALPRALLERGIPNIWTEIGHNGLPEPTDVGRQLHGVFNAMRALGMLAGEVRRFDQRLVGPRHWTVYAEQSGVWRPAVAAGDHVRAGQPLGELVDYFGELLETFASPADALVEYLASSPAINAERQPHGYRWHQLLAQLVEDPEHDRAGGA